MDVYQQITADFFNEFNTEIRRGKYPATKLSGFGTIDQSNGRSRATGIHSKAGNYFEDSSDRIKAKVSNLAINDIP